MGPTVTFSTSTMSVGGEIVGTTSGAHAVTLTNSGNSALTITSMTISPSSFSESNTCGSSLAASASCGITVTFTPATAGATGGTLSITDNAPGSPHEVTLTGMGQDFSIGPYNLTQAIPAGVTAPYALQVAPEGGFSQTVSLACGGAPAQSTCSVTPSSVTLDGRNPVVITLRVATQGASSVLPMRNRPPGSPGLRVLSGAWLAALLGIALLVIAWNLSRTLEDSSLVLFRGAAGDEKSRLSPIFRARFLAALGMTDRRKALAPARLRITAALGAFLLLTLAWAACGGSGAFVNPPPSGGTPSGNYVVTVTATSGHLSHAATVKLTVE
jgi:hypothetical protein